MTVFVDPSAQISPLAEIEQSQRGTCVRVGARSVIDSFVKIKPVGGSGDVVIGSQSYINSGCVLYSGHGIRIGNNVLIAANCTLAATNHAFEDTKRLIREQGFQTPRGGIVVDDDVWIGANCVLLDGAYIERGCVVAAGSVVRSRLAAYGLYGGAPVRLIRVRGAPNAH